MTSRGMMHGLRAAFLPAFLSAALLGVPAHATLAAGHGGGGSASGSRGFSGGGSPAGGHFGGGGSYGGRRFFYRHPSRFFLDFDFGYPYPFYYPHPVYEYGTGYPARGEMRNLPPPGCYYYDPYCDETFSSLEGYLRHLREYDHPQIIQVMDERTDRPVGSYEFVDGRWDPVE